MYAHFYQLAENPFNLTPDPKFHYINESTREAMASILHGIKARKGFITLIGEAGTGKTTLLKRILDEIEGETQVVFVFNPGVSFDELLEFICMELGISTDGRRRLQLLDRLNAHLLEQLTAGRNVVVMIDEAQTLEDGVLEELRMLSNLETSKEKILQILLSGQPELEEKLRRPNLRQLRQRIAVRATLKPMRPDEVAPYVETRLRSAGADRNDFFTPPALRKVWQASRGIPRVVNVVCDNAMMIAFAEGKRRITSRVMSEAIRDLHGQGGNLVETARSWLALPGFRYAAGAVAGLALAVPFALSLGSSGSRDTSEAPATAATPAPSADAAGEVRPSAPRGANGNTLAPEDAAAAVTQPQAQAEADTRIDGTLRDSMRRAEEVARSTAAWLYHSDVRNAPPAAERELHEPVPENNDMSVPAPHAEEENKALASLNEPAKFARDAKPLAVDPKNDDKGIASLQAPLGQDESGAFAPKTEEPAAGAQAASPPPPAKTPPGAQPGDVRPATEVAAASPPAASALAGEALGHASANEHASAEPQKTASAAPTAGGHEVGAEAMANVAPGPKPVKAGSIDLDTPPSAANAKAAGTTPDGASKDAKGTTATAGKPVPEKGPTNGSEPAGSLPRDAKAAATASPAQAPVPPLPANADTAATESLLASAEAAAHARDRAGVGAGQQKREEAPAGRPAAPPSATPARDEARIEPDAAQPVPGAERADQVATASPPLSGVVTFGVDPSEPIIGQLVHVTPGDTVWDIAVAYYGTAGPVTLKRILNSNPTIRDPRHLDVGNHIYLPFQRPEQMVLSGEEGSYRILLAISPEQSRLAAVRAWIESFIDNAQFTTSTVNQGERAYQLQLIGLSSRESALEFATEILAHQDQRRQHGGRRSA